MKATIDTKSKTITLQEACTLKELQIFVERFNLHEFKIEQTIQYMPINYTYSDTTFDKNDFNHVTCGINKFKV